MAGTPYTLYPFTARATEGIRNGVVTVGCFDGVHRGHRYLLDQVAAEARRRGCAAVVMTFDRHPREVLQAGYQPALLTTTADRVALLRQSGMDACAVLHFTPETRKKWRLGVPEEGEYEEIFSSDDPVYGGSGQLNPQPVTAERIPRHGMEYSVEITVPPVGGTLIRRREQKKTAQIKENMDP